jgi:hypothetical protein
MRKNNGLSEWTKGILADKSRIEGYFTLNFHGRTRGKKRNQTLLKTIKTAATVVLAVWNSAVENMCRRNCY